MVEGAEVFSGITLSIYSCSASTDTPLLCFHFIHVNVASIAKSTLPSRDTPATIIHATCRSSLVPEKFIYEDIVMDNFKSKGSTFSKCLILLL